MNEEDRKDGIVVVDKQVIPCEVVIQEGRITAVLIKSDKLENYAVGSGV